VAALLALEGLSVQVGGGVRTSERVAELFAAGASRVVVGTRALEEPAWLEEVAQAHPGRLMVAADVRERMVVTRGWDATLGQDILQVLERLNSLPLAGVLVTAVHMEGQLQGTDLALMREVARRSRWSTYASGGISSMEDLLALAAEGIQGAVVGMALYTGALDAAQVAREFGT
jgi:phosphoribosylformimino-5-aminoimidazole carboxamide ribonucleotide (ProFAR) isomerase